MQSNITSIRINEFETTLARINEILIQDTALLQNDKRDLLRDLNVIRESVRTGETNVKDQKSWQILKRQMDS